MGLSFVILNHIFRQAYNTFVYFYVPCSSCFVFFFCFFFLLKTNLWPRTVPLNLLPLCAMRLVPSLGRITVQWVCLNCLKFGIRQEGVRCRAL